MRLTELKPSFSIIDRKLILLTWVLNCFENNIFLICCVHSQTNDHLVTKNKQKSL